MKSRAPLLLAGLLASGGASASPAAAVQPSKPSPTQHGERAAVPEDEPEPPAIDIEAPPDEGAADPNFPVDGPEPPDLPGDEEDDTQPVPEPSPPQKPAGTQAPEAMESPKADQPQATAPPRTEPAPDRPAKKTPTNRVSTEPRRRSRAPHRAPTLERSAAVPRAAVPRQPMPSHEVAATSPPASTHTVRPGETLWSIAATELGSGATNAEIAAEVRRLWHLNAATIGTGDPNVIRAGQTLRL